MRAPLAQGLPDLHERILALLTWYGSGGGSWSHFPRYENVASQLLLDCSTADILSAIGAAQLTEAQTEGAARLFAQQRIEDSKKLPPELKKRLLEHSLQSEDSDKRDRARTAFK